ncbi:hypothetical protein RV15_GL001997 [Enterococcus silesiacus]|uniref:Uncharacterized protein n=1 Tax=Enterococcus silesiacus TaxID=332949 RepID=A0AA91JN47_9ENTE|nr:hypothetical protein RV15_GL001997 [Enterococcus silesiacus]
MLLFVNYTQFILIILFFIGKIGIKKKKWKVENPNIAIYTESRTKNTLDVTDCFFLCSNLRILKIAARNV